MAKPTRKKKDDYFGGGEFAMTSPALEKLSPSTRVLNVHLSLQEALMLNVALEECIRSLNRYNRSTTQGKNATVNVALHLDTNWVTVHEGKLKASKKTGK